MSIVTLSVLAGRILYCQSIRDAASSEAAVVRRPAKLITASPRTSKPYADHVSFSFAGPTYDRHTTWVGQHLIHPLP